MNIYVLQTGSTLVSSAVPDKVSHHWKYAYTDLFQKRKKRISVPVKAFLIENKGHRVLVDTGWSEECETHPIKHLGFSLWFASQPFLKKEEAIPNQLCKMGIKPGDIDAILITHLDCDHVSGLLPLKEAKNIYCSQQEWDIANKGGDPRYRKKFWNGAKMKTLCMQDDSSAPFGKSVDVLGDGSFRAVLTPGHSAGSIAILAKGENGYAAFVGDDSYSRHSWEEDRLPGVLYDRKMMEVTLAWVKKLSKDRNCIGIYAVHDPEGPKGGMNL